MTTVTAVTLGLGIVNLFNPGKVVSQETRENLLAAYATDANQRIELLPPRPTRGRCPSW